MEVSSRHFHYCNKSPFSLSVGPQIPSIDATGWWLFVTRPSGAEAFSRPNARAAVGMKIPVGIPVGIGAPVRFVKTASNSDSANTTDAFEN